MRHQTQGLGSDVSLKNVPEVYRRSQIRRFIDRLQLFSRANNSLEQAFTIAKAGS